MHLMTCGSQSQFLFLLYSSQLSRGYRATVSMRFLLLSQKINWFKKMLESPSSSDACLTKSSSDLNEQILPYRLDTSSTIPTAFYIPDFITQDEANYLWDRVNNAPKPKWTQLKKRRLQNWGVIPLSEKSGSAGIAEPLPDWLDRIGQRIAKLGVFEGKPPNHCLVNEYTLDQGIMPHQDGPHYFPTVATVSLGSPCVLSFFPHRAKVEGCDHPEPPSSPHQEPEAYLYLESNSLVVLRDELYTSYLHGIDESPTWTLDPRRVMNSQALFRSLDESTDVIQIKRTGTRISLTFRVWSKVISKSKFGLLKR